MRCIQNTVTRTHTNKTDVWAQRTAQTNKYMVWNVCANSDVMIATNALANGALAASVHQLKYHMAIWVLRKFQSGRFFRFKIKTQTKFAKEIEQ